MSEWLEIWVKNQWRTANRKPVKNQDLWERLLELSQRHEVHWHWVKGHAGNEYNERVDKLVVRADGRKRRDTGRQLPAILHIQQHARQQP